MSNADFDNSVLPLLTEHYAHFDRLDTSEYTGSTAIRGVAAKTPEKLRFKTSILKSNEKETVLKPIRSRGHIWHIAFLLFKNERDRPVDRHFSSVCYVRCFSASCGMGYQNCIPLCRVRRGLIECTGIGNASN